MYINERIKQLAGVLNEGVKTSALSNAIDISNWSLKLENDEGQKVHVKDLEIFVEYVRGTDELTGKIHIYYDSDRYGDLYLDRTFLKTLKNSLAAKGVDRKGVNKIEYADNYAIITNVNKKGEDFVSFKVNDKVLFDLIEIVKSKKPFPNKVLQDISDIQQKQGHR